MRRVLGQVAVGTAIVFGLTVAAPVDAVRDPELPVSWLWSWLSQRPAWAKPNPAVPQQQRGSAGGDQPASSADTNVDRFGDLPGVAIHNFLSMSPGEIGAVLKSPGTVIGAFCHRAICFNPYR